MKKLVILLIIVIFCHKLIANNSTTNNSTTNNSISICDGGWESYIHKKCYKIFDIGTYYDARHVCQEHNSSILSILSQGEQEFLTNFLFNKSGIVGNVWLKAKFINNSFKWDQETDLIYTNWAVGFPIYNLGLNCLEMHSMSIINKLHSRIFTLDNLNGGKWFNVICIKENMIVCQKTQHNQTLSLPDSQLEFVEITFEKIKRDLKNENEKLRNDISKISLAQTELINLLIPINFTYTQLPHEHDPGHIWPMYEWKDVTSVYAGHFFRAEGGQSSQFGRIQYGNSPKITNIKYVSDHEYNSLINITYNDDWSPTIMSDKYVNSYNKIFAFSFYTSGGEVRPINMAVRIWKRIK